MAVEGGHVEGISVVVVFYFRWRFVVKEELPEKRKRSSVLAKTRILANCRLQTNFKTRPCSPRNQPHITFTCLIRKRLWSVCFSKYFQSAIQAKPFWSIALSSRTRSVDWSFRENFTATFLGVIAEKLCRIGRILLLHKVNAFYSKTKIFVIDWNWSLLKHDRLPFHSLEK